MSFNSKAYFAHEERLLEPDTILIKGNYKWHKPIIEVHNVAVKPPVVLTEAEDNRRQDAYLASKGVIMLMLIFMVSCTPSHLHKGWYTYKQLQRAGYSCTPYKGSHYIRPTNDSLKANIWQHQ